MLANIVHRFHDSLGHFFKHKLGSCRLNIAVQFGEIKQSLLFWKTLASFKRECQRIALDVWRSRHNAVGGGKLLSNNKDDEGEKGQFYFAGKGTFLFSVDRMVPHGTSAFPVGYAYGLLLSQ